MKVKIIIGILILVCFGSAVFAVRADKNDFITDQKDIFKQVRLLTDSISLISSDYVEPVKAKDLIYGAIKGMMDTLDGYSQFMDPDSFKEITEETRGEFGGIGIEIGIRDGVLTVITPMEDTPAFDAGVQTNDKIVKINDEVTRDMTLDDAVKHLRGEPGTNVDISVVREDVDEVLKFTLGRTVIKLDSIKEAKVLADNVGYVRIVEFQKNTAKDLIKAIRKLKAKGAKNLVIDVRNNPGGLLDASVGVADIFLEQGELIVYTRGRSDEDRLDFYATKKPQFSDMPLIILVNNGSASASEILAGAIKDNKRGLVVGETSFGKGSVQTVIPLEDKSALRLTTAAYFTPSGKSLMKKGIKPDVFVKRRKFPEKKKDSEDKKTKKGSKTKIFGKVDKKKKKEEKKIDRSYEEDNQLETAINILKGVNIFQEARE